MIIWMCEPPVLFFSAFCCLVSSRLGRAVFGTHRHTNKANFAGSLFTPPRCKGIAKATMTTLRSSKREAANPSLLRSIWSICFAQARDGHSTARSFAATPPAPPPHESELPNRRGQLPLIIGYRVRSERKAAAVRLWLPCGRAIQ